MLAQFRSLTKKIFTVATPKTSKNHQMYATAAQGRKTSRQNCLNFSKTEFLLIGLKNQLAKIHNSSHDTSRSARNLGFIFDEYLTFSDQITALSKACYYHIRQLRCIRPYLDSSTACTIATSIVQSKLDYCNSLYYKLPISLNYPVSSRPRTLLLVLSSKLPSPDISLPSYQLAQDH